MLRALLIRQAFLLLDFVLVALVAFVAFLAISTYLDSSSGQFRGGPSETGPQTIEVARLDDRDAYRVIESSGLFGDAARSRQDETPPPPPPPPPPTDDEVSTLPLRLWGTVNLGDPEHPLNTAVIEQTRGARSRDVYFVGSIIDDGVEVREIHYRRVRLFNPNQNRHEWLLPPPPPDRPAAAVAPRRTTPAPQPREVSGPSVTMNPQDLVTRMQTEGMDIYQRMAPTMRVATDDAGNPLGLTADGIGEVPLAQELGFQDGDILQQINGRPVENPAQLMGLLQQFQGVDTFRVSVLRNGSPQMLTISLR